MQTNALERVIMYLVVALIVLATVFGCASIFVDDFRADGSTIVTIVLGALTTMASILAGGYIAREQFARRDGDEDISKTDVSKGGNDDEPR